MAGNYGFIKGHFSLLANIQITRGAPSRRVAEDKRNASEDKLVKNGNTFTRKVKMRFACARFSGTTEALVICRSER
jgi:hypothetical protein